MILKFTCSLFLVLCLVNRPAAGYNLFSGAPTSELSYFFGSRTATDTICFEKTITKGSITPVLVQYTNPAAKVINFVTINADRYYKYGYSVYIERGAMATVTISFRLSGKRVLPYNVVFQFWCAA
ncbi:uncharacterized protein LOC131436106 [Malaya genurostris]|uniref:uncharacterized protein LOC131436106 n=1 Tax=Malaya genurostris TaxID=325434 RepID=UPI0026F3CB2E|nr:uncharacterized protein LOC131436106 [Malaya genurostris]